MSMKFVFLPVMWHRSHTGCLWQWCHRGGTQTWTLYGRGHPDTDHRTPFMTPQHTLATKRSAWPQGKLLLPLSLSSGNIADDGCGNACDWLPRHWIWAWSTNPPLQALFTPVFAAARDMWGLVCVEHIWPHLGSPFYQQNHYPNKLPLNWGALCPPFYFFGSMNIHHRQCMDRNENQDTKCKP